MPAPHSIWAVIPAAGIGRRMQSHIPKQYLRVGDRAIIEHSLDRLLDIDRVSGVVLALQMADPYWPQLHYRHRKPVRIAEGGDERCDSVRNAIRLLLESSDDTETLHVLVHDAVRPCVRSGDINRLIDTALVDDHGGLLAMPVRDTIKRQKAGSRVDATIDRSDLWHALTPQLFRAVLLHDALESAMHDGVEITDESSAMEYAGYSPRLVEGAGSNIKVTRPDDLELAARLLATGSA
jgi:2-C-methyl-D-erythritol 4-phosphate cytidylyltransferase